MNGIKEKSYTQIQKEASLLLKEAQEKVKHLGYSSHALQWKEIEQLMQKEKFSLSVVGDFSRGKSTFINAFIGQKVLPAKMRPTTAFINRIFDGEDGVVTLIKREGEEHLDFKDFQKKIAPMAVDRDDDESEQLLYENQLEELQNVVRADIAFPLPSPLKNVEIFDTPGMNDIYEQREQVTKGFLPHSDAVIFLLSATNNLTKSEMDFLRNEIIHHHIRKVFFVINFKDRLQSQEDGKRVMEYIKRNLESINELPEVKMYLVSSLEALNIKLLEQGESISRRKKVYETIEETGFTNLEHDLLHFFEFEQGYVKLDKPMRKFIQSLRAFCKKDLENEVRLLDEERGKLNKALEKEEENLHLMRKKSQEEEDSLRSRLTNRKKDLKKESKRLFDQLYVKIDATIGSYAGQMSDEGLKRHFETVSAEVEVLYSDMVDELEQYMVNISREEIERTLEELRISEDKLQKEEMMRSHHSFSMTEGVLHEIEEELFYGGMIAGGLLIGAGLIAAPLMLVLGAAGAILGLFNFATVSRYVYQKKFNSQKKKYLDAWKKTHKNQDKGLSKTWNHVSAEVIRHFRTNIHHNFLQHQEHLNVVKNNNMMNQVEVETRKLLVKQTQTELGYLAGTAERYTLGQGGRG